jgi:hypothetical protein
MSRIWTKNVHGLAAAAETVIMPAMRTKLRVAGLLLALAVTVFWLFGGPNLGWTKTSVPQQRVDPVTELKFTVYESRFVPGVDFLAAGLAAAGLLASSSFLFRKTAAGQKPL